MTCRLFSPALLRLHLGQAVGVDVSLAGRQQPAVDLCNIFLLPVLLLLLPPAHPVHVEDGHELRHLVLGEQLDGALLVRLGGEGEDLRWEVGLTWREREYLNSSMRMGEVPSRRDPDR